MILSACTAAFGMADLKTIIDTAAKIGYDAVEITAALHTPVDTTPQRRREVKGYLRDAGVTCSGLHYIFDGTLRLLSQDAEMMKKSVDYLNKVVDLAADFEAPTVIVGSGGITRNFEPGWDRPQSIACMQEVLHTVGDHAGEKGVILAVEAINRYETQFLNTMQEASEFVLQIDHPNVRTMADTYHMNIEEKDPAESVRRYGYLLQNLHLADSNRMAPGDGHFDFKSVVQALKDIGYSKVCSYEVFGLYPWKLWFDTFEESVEHMTNGLNYMRALFD
ncbi:MAG: sugar phosphate isomerase/epimerase [Oscillospiraceae bacterium]|nr:sugar phosphate isomerase/epimerase [Oscillospiraceae bacterium]